jgi:hypothetical protein
LSATSLAPQTAAFRLLCPETLTSSRWLQFSLSEPNNYVAANPLRSGRRNRTKESIETVCHRHLDFDIGKADLTSLPASDTVATPTAILPTSLGKYQLHWRVVGFTFTHQESRLKLRTIVLGIYLDRTGCNRILQLQGLPHCEYDSAYPFTVEHSCDSTRNPDRSWLDISATNVRCFRLAQSHCECVSNA